MKLRTEIGSVRDTDTLIAIENECFATEAFSRKQISLLLGDYNTIAIKALDDGNVLGFVIGQIQLERGATVGHIITIDVLPAYRKRGIGTILLEAVETIFRQKHLQSSFLEVRKDNSEALRLYVKAGYENVGKLERYYGSVDAICMVKPLARSEKV